VGELEAGGRLSDVARKLHVKPKTLAWWRWRLKGERPEVPRLLPVVVAPTAVVTEPVTIDLRMRDVALRFTTGADVAYIARLVAALRT
jgi:transposase-like protein